MTLLKYPRTRHIEGSRLQKGDTNDDMKISALKKVELVVEEKVDGANCGISFDQNGQLLLQSRGHYLFSGHRERHFNLLKTWANTHASIFHDVLSHRYVMYGEWMYAKHTVFYDYLPHYFMEFDVFDRDQKVFLSTNARYELLKGLPIVPVPVLFKGVINSIGQIEELVQPSLYKSKSWRVALQLAAKQSGSRSDFVEKQTEDNNLAEGLYFKKEKNRHVEERFKYVRSDFIQAIESSQGHWQDRPILPNILMDGINIFASKLGVSGAYDAS